MSSTPVAVTFGEAMLRLSPPAGERLPGARQLRMFVGGSEANIAAGLSGLGVGARWFSRASSTATGDAVLGEIRAHGVDVSFVKRAKGRTGLYFLEEGDGPRPASVVYDRADSAFASIAADDVLKALDSGLLDGAAALVTTGITLALGAGPAAAAALMWESASGRLRCFDVNYRATLGSPAEAAEAAAPFLATADIVFVAERDAVNLFGSTDLRHVAGNAMVVITRGSSGAAATSPDGESEWVPALPVGESGRIGRGDAFVAGFLSGILRGRGLESSLRLGVASASYKSSLAGDLARLERKAVEEMASGAEGGDIVR